MVRDWVDSSGTVVNHAGYDSIGNRLNAVFGWTGRYRDPLTGLQWNWHRWYKSRALPLEDCIRIRTGERGGDAI